MLPVLRAVVRRIEEQFQSRLFIGYVACAGMATLCDLGLLYLLTEVGGLWYLWSAGISYTTGMVINYSLNKYLNFRNRSGRIVLQFGLFVAVALAGLVLNQVAIYSLVHLLGLWYLTAKGIAIFLVMFWSFYGHKRFTFSILR